MRAVADSEESHKVRFYSVLLRAAQKYLIIPKAEACTETTVCHYEIK